MQVQCDYALQVQGVFFRDSTVEEGKKLGVVGWVKNTSKGTVVGQVQGTQDAAAQMKASQFSSMHHQDAQARYVME